MKFSQSIEYNKRKCFFKNHEQNEAERLIPDLCLLFKKALYDVKTSGLQLSFNIFRQPSSWHITLMNCAKIQSIDPKICSILIFQKRAWDQFLHHILGVIFQEKSFSYYILLTDQVSPSDCLYFLRYRATCVLLLFISEVVTS